MFSAYQKYISQNITFFLFQQPTFPLIDYMATTNIWANVNIDFRISKTMTFPKMYSFANLPKKYKCLNHDIVRTLTNDPSCKCGITHSTRKRQQWPLSPEFGLRRLAIETHMLFYISNTGRLPLHILHIKIHYGSVWKKNWESSISLRSY